VRKRVCGGEQEAAGAQPGKLERVFVTVARSDILLLPTQQNQPITNKQVRAQSVGLPLTSTQYDRLTPQVLVDRLVQVVVIALCRCRRLDVVVFFVVHRCRFKAVVFAFALL
jgi:hypothetical protein